METLLEACASKPETAEDLCFLISRANPERAKENAGELLLAAVEELPHGCKAYAWRFLIRDRSIEIDEYEHQLIAWLSTGRVRGIRGVILAFAERPDVLKRLKQKLPKFVVDDVERVMRSPR